MPTLLRGLMTQSLLPFTRAGRAWLSPSYKLVGQAALCSCAPDWVWTSILNARTNTTTVKLYLLILGRLLRWRKGWTQPFYFGGACFSVSVLIVSVTWLHHVRKLSSGHFFFFFLTPPQLFVKTLNIPMVPKSFSKRKWCCAFKMRLTGFICAPLQT